MNATATRATTAQFAEIRNLLAKLAELDTTARDTKAAALNDARDKGEFTVEFADFAARELRATIGTLTARPAATGAYINEDTVPEGRYALDGTGANETVFYIVKWWDGRKGRMFSVYLQVSDNEVRVNFAAAKQVLAAIAEAGPREATIRYGHELGVCGACGRTLTNDASRAAGIGPICAAKF